MNQIKKSGFTLVELIVVITILAILGTIAFISLEGYSSQARDSKRISDIQNIKTSLELFSLNTGKYPTPDTGFDVTYDSDIVWTQGVIGDNVTTNLSRNLNSKPVDPLTETEYTYSVIDSKTQYELLSIYESDLLSFGPPSIRLKGRNLGWVNQTNAANQSYPKIDGTYNGVFVKTPKYYIPTPSIINSELDGIGGELSNENIDSQIITGGENNIANGQNTVEIDGLPNLNLSVYTGTTLDNDTKKIDLGLAIQAAYTGSKLANTDIYKDILNTPEDELVTLVNNVVLGGDLVSSSGGLDDILVIKNSLDDCSNSGELIYTTEDGTNNNLICENDIIVCSGIGTGYIIQACNIGATLVGNDFTNIQMLGNYFQWGNNFGSVDGSPTISSLVDASSYGPGNFYSSTSFILGSSSFRYDWTTIKNDNLWGDNLGIGTNVQRQGPCNIGYHVPSHEDWLGLISAGDGFLWDISGTSTEGTDFSNILELPLSGERKRSSGIIDDKGNMGKYWSSTSRDNDDGDNLVFNGSILDPNNSGGNRANGFSIRCFKN